MGKVANVHITKPKCVACGARLQVSKKQSKINQNIAIIVGYCFKREKHNTNATLKFYIESKIANKSSEPEADNIVEVKQLHSDLG